MVLGSRRKEQAGSTSTTLGIDLAHSGLQAITVRICDKCGPLVYAEAHAAENVSGKAADQTRT